MNKVKWIVVDKKLIKFFELNKSYNIADDVKDEALVGIGVGSEVEMEIKDDLVVKIALITAKKEEKPEVKETEAKKEAVKKEEPTKETEPKEKAVKKEESAKETKEAEKNTKPANGKNDGAPEKPEPTEPLKMVTWTVSAFNSPKGVFKFEEQPTKKYWYVIVDKEVLIKAQSLNKGDKVTILIGKVMVTSSKGTNYEKDGIVDIKDIEAKVEEETPESKETAEDTSSDDTEPRKKSSSIERQVALKEAGNIICSLIGSEASMVNSEDKIKALLLNFTKTGLKAMNDA